MVLHEDTQGPELVRIASFEDITHVAAAHGSADSVRLSGAATGSDEASIWSIELDSGRQPVDGSLVQVGLGSTYVQVTGVLAQDGDSRLHLVLRRDA